MAHPFQGLLQVSQVLGLAQEGLLQLLLQGLQKLLSLRQKPGVWGLAQAVDQGPEAGHLRPVHVEPEALQALLQLGQPGPLVSDLGQHPLHQPPGLLRAHAGLELTVDQALQEVGPIRWGELGRPFAQAL